MKLASENQQKINLLVISSTRPHHTTCEENMKLIEYFNFNVVRVNTIQESYSYIINEKNNFAWVSIDIEDLYNMAGVGMFEIIHTLATLIRSINSKTKIVAAITKNTDLKLIRDAISNIDISGFIARVDGFTPQEAKESINDLLANKYHIPKHTHDLLHPKKNKVTKVVVSKNTIKLTSRQNQILDMVTNRGASNKMIAKTLNISESTVKLHIGTILKKFGVRNRTQLAIFGKSYTHV